MSTAQSDDQGSDGLACHLRWEVVQCYPLKLGSSFVTSGERDGKLHATCL